MQRCSVSQTLPVQHQVLLDDVLQLADVPGIVEVHVRALVSLAPESGLILVWTGSLAGEPPRGYKMQRAGV